MCVGRQQRWLGLQVFQVIDNDLRFAKRPVFGLNKRNLAQRAERQGIGILGGAVVDLLEGNVLFEQRELHLVVVVADRKAMQFDH